MTISKSMAVMAAMVLGSGAAWAQFTSTNLSFSVNQTIPDANANGIAFQENLNLNTLNGPISALTVHWTSAVASTAIFMGI